MNRPVAPFTLPDDDSAPPLPPGFTLDPHPAETPANDTAPALPPGFTADAPVSEPMQGGFADELPQQTSTKMAPEDVAMLEGMARSGASADQLRAFAHSKGFEFPNADDAVAFAKAHPGQHLGHVDGLPQADSSTAQAFQNGVSQGASLGTSDEIHGFLNGVGALVHGGSFGDTYNRTVDQDRAQLGADEQQHGIASLVGNIAGGVALPLGLEKAGLTASMEAVALRAGQDAIASGATPEAAKIIAARAVARRMAVEGGAYGAGYGAGTAEGGPGERLSGAAVGGAEGAAGGAIFGRFGIRAAGKTPTPAASTAGQDVAAAAGRQGIDVLPADVGGATVRRLTAGAAQTPFGASPIAAAAERMTDQSQAVRDKVASSIGTALAPEQMGDQARSGALAYIRNSGVAKNAMYDAAEKAAGDTKVAPTQALSTLDGHIAELSETPGGAPGLSTLQGLRDALASGDVSVRGLRNMRTTLRDQFMKDGLTGSDLERRVNTVLDASKSDITQGLQDAGKGGAASLFDRADAFYRDRAQTIDNTLKPLIGTREKPKSGEQIANALTSDLKGNNARAVKFLNALPPEEQANTRASIIGRMGRISEGAQNPDGDAFSLPAFLTSWNKIGDTAKRAYFGSEGMSALNDLATVANGTKLAQRYANHSNTGGAVEAGRLLTAVTALPTLGASVGGQYALGHLLASPRFARWLARAPRTALSEPSYIERLGRIARAEPAIASEVTGLQQHLLATLHGNPISAAAQETPDHPAVANGQNAQQQAPANEFQP